MRVAVLSDIHSNYHAFRACFGDALGQGVEQFIFLGDYVSDLAEPERTMDLLYEIRASYPTICLRGNRERYMLEGAADFSRGSKSGSLLFTYEQLRQGDLAFFGSLKQSDTIELGGVQMEIAHGAMEDDRCYFDTEDSRIDAIFDQMACKYLLTGHSHRCYVCSRGGKTIINPGSVGIPQDGTRWPKYAILDIENGEVACTLREVPYDLEPVIRAQFASGLVDYAKYLGIGILYDIIRGEECVLALLTRVRAAGDVQDEALWRREALALGMQFTEEEILKLASVQ